MENLPKQKEPLVKIKNLKKYFRIGQQWLKAVNNLNLDIMPGETVGLVGESGCGKSTAGRTIVRLYPATAGEVYYNRVDILKLPGQDMKQYRKKMQMIFQDPYASLNPRMTVEDIIGEPMDIHRLAMGKERREKVRALLELVGLQSEHMSRYPHEFSGGQRQRIGIARALAVNPEFIICDEPISALDVSIQAQVVNLMKDLQEQMGLTYLFIAHDLSMVRYISNRILVMYLGNMAELADSDRLHENPLHPYTQALHSAVPIADPAIEQTRKRIPLEGEVPSPLNPPTGCSFHTRCVKAMDICKKEMPRWQEVEEKHYIACHLYK